jgi:hypothetical protein
VTYCTRGRRTRSPCTSRSQRATCHRTRYTPLSLVPPRSKWYTPTARLTVHRPYVLLAQGSGNVGDLDETEFAPTRRGFRKRSTSFEVRLPKRYLADSAHLPLSPQRRYQETLQVSNGTHPLSPRPPGGTGADPLLLPYGDLSDNEEDDSSASPTRRRRARAYTSVHAVPASARPAVALRRPKVGGRKEAPRWGSAGGSPVDDASTLPSPETLLGAESTALTRCVGGSQSRRIGGKGYRSFLDIGRKYPWCWECLV